MDAVNDVLRMFNVAVNDLERKNPLTRKFDKLQYEYYSGGQDGRKRTVRFVYTTLPNIAGYYLSCKEVRGKKFGRRMLYKAHKTEGAAATRALKMYKAFKRKRAGTS